MMKQKDWLLVIMVAIVAGVFGLVLSNIFIASPKNRQTKVEVVTPITAEFRVPDKKYFNEKSIDPTLPIQIGTTTNPKPFNGSQ